MNKRIICTLGPASLNPRTIARLEELGVSLFRINLSHTKVEKVAETIDTIRASTDVPVCLDTQGAQIRSGVFGTGTVSLRTDAIVELVAAPTIGDTEHLPIYPAFVLDHLVVGDFISIDFGTALLHVLAVGERCRARVLSGGTIGSNKAISMDRPMALPPLTEDDLASIEIGKERGIDHYALSFTNSPEDVHQLRALVGPEPFIISKIESRLGLVNLSAILEAANAILIDRGDLSREVPIERLPFVQKRIIAEANRQQVPVYIATNLLESMVSSPRPTRAEANDVINTLLDGADGLVLAAETAIGAYPVGCASMIRSFIRAFENPPPAAWHEIHTMANARLIEPLGGRLVDRVLTETPLDELRGLPRLEVDARTMMDVVQISVGTYSPLTGFMTRAELESVLASHRLPSGVPWPMPILLNASADACPKVQPGDRLVLTRHGTPRALLTVSDAYQLDLDWLAQHWFGTDSRRHPGVDALHQGSDRFLGGTLELLPEGLGHRQPYDLTPAQARLIFEFRQWEKVVGFHSRNVPHRAHEYLQLAALESCHADGLFVHPVIGPKKSGDFSGDILLRAYQLLLDGGYAGGRSVLGGFLTYSRYAGPREAVFTALCRRNYGCTHFIVGRDHTGVADFYDQHASQRLFEEIDDLGIEPVFFDEVKYCRACGDHVQACAHGDAQVERISGSQARDRLRRGQPLPDWYMRSELSDFLIAALKRGEEVFVP